MPYSMLLNLQQKPVQTLKQFQRLIMSRQMQQAIHLLQMPIMELSPAIAIELEQNPVLECLEEGEDAIDQDFETEWIEDETREESLDKDTVPETELSFDDGDFEIMRRLDEDFRDYVSESGSYIAKRSSEQDKLQTFLENSVCSIPTFFEHLMTQATEVFEDKEDMGIAEILIGSLDESGLLTASLQELAVLKGCSLDSLERVLAIIQTFQPSGVGARDLKESLLIQLHSQGKVKTLAYHIIEKHFDDLLHNRIPMIKRGLHCTSKQVNQAIESDIAKLELHPASGFSSQKISCIVPDVTLHQEGENFIVAVNEESIPRLRLNGRYLRMLDDETLTQETKEFIKQKIVSAKWLFRNLLQRNDTLKKIAECLAKWQRAFFLSPEGNLIPLTMQTVADELQMHESTIARAVSNKYIDTPRGLLPLRFFFTNALITQEGKEISSETVRNLLLEIIDKEDKSHPLSDEAISADMREKGIQCARRTVAKYRAALKLGSARQRRKF